MTELQARFPEALYHVGDLTEPATTAAWVERTKAKFGRIDLLINNAAIQGPGGKLHELDWVETQATIATNLTGPIFLIGKALPLFQTQGSGMVIGLSGGGATGPRPFFSPYAASKAALVRLVENLALEYPDLHFYAIAPGPMNTAMLRSVAEMDPTKIGSEQAAARRVIESGGEDPRRAAELALWLFENRPRDLSGCLISAIWDDYRRAHQKPAKAGWWKLRRIDSVAAENLKEST